MLKSDYDIWYKREKHNDDTSLKKKPEKVTNLFMEKEKKFSEKIFSENQKMTIYRYAFDKNVILIWSSILIDNNTLDIILTDSNTEFQNHYQLVFFFIWWHFYEYKLDSKNFFDIPIK